MKIVFKLEAEDYLEYLRFIISNSKEQKYRMVVKGNYSFITSIFIYIF